MHDKFIFLCWRLCLYENICCSYFKSTRQQALINQTDTASTLHLLWQHVYCSLKMAMKRLLLKLYGSYYSETLVIYLVWEKVMHFKNASRTKKAVFFLNIFENVCQKKIVSHNIGFDTVKLVSYTWVNDGYCFFRWAVLLIDSFQYSLWLTIPYP